MFPLFDKTRLQLGDVMNLAVLHTLMQLPPDLVVYWADVRMLAGQRVGAMKFAVNSCMVSRALWAGALSSEQNLLPDQ